MTDEELIKQARIQKFADDDELDALLRAVDVGLRLEGRIAELERENDGLRKQNAALLADATRYRWLRTQRHTDKINVGGKWADGTMVNWTCDVLDLAIDAQMDEEIEALR